MAPPSPMCISKLPKPCNVQPHDPSPHHLSLHQHRGCLSAPHALHQNRSANTVTPSIPSHEEATAGNQAANSPRPTLSRPPKHSCHKPLLLLVLSPSNRQRAECSSYRQSHHCSHHSRKRRLLHKTPQRPLSKNLATLLCQQMGPIHPPAWPWDHLPTHQTSQRHRYHIFYGKITSSQGPRKSPMPPIVKS
jgi:hypothetical protein